MLGLIFAITISIVLAHYLILYSGVIAGVVGTVISSVIILALAAFIAFKLIELIKQIPNIIKKIPYYFKNLPSIIQYEFRLIMGTSHNYSKLNYENLESSEHAQKQRALIEKQKAIDEETRDQVREQMRIRDSKKTYY